MHYLFRLLLIIAQLLFQTVSPCSHLFNIKFVKYVSYWLLSLELSIFSPFNLIYMGASKRMEKLALRSSSTRAKIMGTLVSISGALVIVLYEGPKIISTSSQPSSLSHHFPLGSSQTKRVIGGLLLAVEYLLFSMWYIVQVLAQYVKYGTTLKIDQSANFEFCGILQTQVMKIYPSEIVVTFLCMLCGTVISAPLCLIAETNLSAWRLKPDIALVTIVYSVRN